MLSRSTNLTTTSFDFNNVIVENYIESTTILPSIISSEISFDANCENFQSAFYAGKRLLTDEYSQNEVVYDETSSFENLDLHYLTAASAEELTEFYEKEIKLLRKQLENARCSLRYYRRKDALVKLGLSVGK